MSMQTLVVGFDFGPCGALALERALQMARHAPEHTTVHVTHVVAPADLPSGAEMQRQDAALGTLPERIMTAVVDVLHQLDIPLDAFPVIQHVRLGAPVEALLQVAVDVDATLLVVGTHNRKGLGRLLLGSVAEALVRDGRVPVLVAHPNTLSEMPKTPRPDAALSAEELSTREKGGERPHTYRFGLLDAWSAFGRSGNGSLAPPR